MDFSAAKKLQEAGFSEEQIEALHSAFEMDLATKSDIRDIIRDLKELDLRMTMKISGIVVAGIALIKALDKLL